MPGTPSVRRWKRRLVVLLTVFTLLVTLVPGGAVRPAGTHAEEPALEAASSDLPAETTTTTTTQPPVDTTTTTTTEPPAEETTTTTITEPPPPDETTTTTEPPEDTTTDTTEPPTPDETTTTTEPLAEASVAAAPEQIIVEMQTLPAGAATPFDFTGDAAGTISDGETIVVDVTPGMYTSTEIVPTGWDITDIICNDADSSGDIGTATATFKVEAGETVTCRFTNTLRGSITIAQQTTGGTASIGFKSATLPESAFALTTSGEGSAGTSVQVFSNLEPGTYDVSGSVPAGWDLTSATCSGAGNTPSSIALDPGDSVVCTFVVALADHEWAGNKISQHFTWSPGTQTWVTGLPQGYSEGDTAPFKVPVVGVQGDRLKFQVCLELETGEALSFTDLEPWDTTYSNMSAPPRPPPLTGNAGGFNGGGTTIDAAVFLGLEGGLCSRNFQGWEVQFTVNALSGVSWVVYGGHIAAQGDLIASGGTVPDGRGAAFVAGTFQARLASPGAGQFTVPFKGSDIEPDPNIDIEKSTNSEDADVPTGPFTPVGDPVNWEYVVTNTGTSDLTDITVVDDDGVAVTCPQDTLAPGESMTCTASGTAIAGQYANVATVTGTPPAGGPISDEDPSHYFGSAPAIDIEKSTNAEDADTPTGPEIPVGNPVAWKYAVTNAGNVELANITVVDDQGVAVSCPQDTLAPGESMTCDAAGTAAAGQYVNLGSVSGFDPNQTEVTADDPSHYFGADSTITIQKQTLGDVGWFEFSSNTLTPSPFTLTTAAEGPPGTAIKIFDNLVSGTYDVAETGVADGFQLTDASCSNGDDLAAIMLDPGEDVTCTFINSKNAMIVVEKQTLPNGQLAQFTFTGDVAGTIGDGEQLSVEVTPGSYVSTETLPEGWELDDISCDDDNSSGDVATKTATFNAEAGETVTCVFTNISGKVRVRKTTIGGTGSFEFTSNTLSPSQFTLTTTAEGSAGAVEKHFPNLPPGTYDVAETVPAGWDLTSTRCFDRDTGADRGSPDSIVVEPGEVVICDFVNTKQNPVVDIEKSTNGQDADAPTGPFIPVGDPVTWEYVVTNTGNVELIPVRVFDSVIGSSPITCPQTMLGVGESMRCTATGTAEPGQYENRGRALARSPAGTIVTDVDPSHYF